MTSNVDHISDASAQLDDRVLYLEAPPVEPTLLAESQIALASCEKLVFVAACVEASQWRANSRWNSKVLTAPPPFASLGRERREVSLRDSSRSSLVAAHFCCLGAVEI